MTQARENYGQDAPTVVRNLAIIGGAILIGEWTTGAGGLWFQRLPGWVIALRPTLLTIGWTLTAMALWMVVSSRWLKPLVLKSLLDQRAWRGDEAVLDIGCGRGLVAIEAARRAPRGYVTAIDLWREVDLGGNGPDAIRANAVAAGVADRLTIDTGDARALPYPDASFDVVASMTAIHNIPDAADRAVAIAEAWRVTRPGGQVLIFDIRHARAYAAQLKALGAVDIRMSLPILLWGVLGWRFAATKPA